MPNPEHAALVRQVENWNRWREEHHDLPPNLSGANLSGPNLIEANLTRTDLREADLRDANLSRADLRGAYLIETNLGRANLSGANLTYTLLWETIFGNTNLRDAKDLEACNFQGPCTLDHRTIQGNGGLPLPFLRGCGLPDSVNRIPTISPE
jgi:uncharacterized protein YjbI with pentapeptide repeats